MRLSRSIINGAQAAACALLFCAIAVEADAQSSTPKRVVSVNLCTDQLALMIASPGQIISLSRLAHDPMSSAMVDKARQFPTNGSGAEEVYLLQPDLVLAGTFTSAATVNLLRNLGITVEQFAPAQSLSDVPDRLAQMGRALRQEARAEALTDAFHHRFDALTRDLPPTRPRAAITYVNSYSSGDATLAGDILKHAGFDNIAKEIGLTSVGTLALEELVLLAPDVIIQGRDYPGAARAEDNLNHPALHALPDTLVAGEISDRDWICGTPHVLNALSAMRDLRLRLEGAE